MSAVFLLSLACILDRTGQSASTQMQREIRDNGVRIYNVEQQFVQVEARVNQLEELSRSKRQQKIVQSEALDQIREQMAANRPVRSLSMAWFCCGNALSTPAAAQAQVQDLHREAAVATKTRKTPKGLV